MSYITSIERLGIEQGLQQSREEGRHEEARTIAKNFKEQGSLVCN